MDKRYTSYIGLYDKITKRQEIATVDAQKIVYNIICDKVGGGTVTTGDGIYTHDDGTTVIEPSLICIVFDCDEQALIEALMDIKVALNQESVALEICDVTSRFI